MRQLILCSLVLFSTSALRAQPKTDYPALKQRLQRGNYAEAREGYDALTKAEKPPLAAFIGQAHCWRAEGQYAKAMDVLDAAIKSAPDALTLISERADLNFALGKWDDASKDAEVVLKKDDANFLARWVRARILRDRGDLAAADKEVRWFVTRYTEASEADKEITDPEQLLLVGYAGAENARWNDKPGQFSFIVNDLAKDILKHDADCWQAEVLAGRLLLEKHNRADAADAFDKALKINPKAVEANVGKALIALAELDYAAATRFADQALNVNAKHPDALRIKADVRLAEGEIGAAERWLLTAKLVNARDEATLARLAVVAHLTRKPDEYTAVIAEVTAFNAKPGTFYLELAESLALRKQYAKAEECYLKAIELRPDLSAAKAGLGLLFMQLGREPEAKVQLDAAFKADPFHVRVSNARDVLKHLAEYATTETAHFVIKFDPKNDKVFAAFLADYLEEWHAEFAKLYGYSPPGKILVEVFAARQMFSGRILSLPGLPGAVQGASTGPLIAIPSPRADGESKPYNWGVVARHELTHVFNLMQTGFLAPIWLTEGLAVRAERTRRFEVSLPLLRDRLANGTAFDLETIGRAYHNFANPPDVTLAYLQGWQYVEYIIATHGEAAIAKLLDAFRTGLDATAAIRKVCGLSKAEFEKGHRDHLATLVKSLPRSDPVLTVAQLEAGHKKSPDDADIAARLAGEYLRRGKAAEARKLVDAALEKSATHAGASLVKARLLQRDKDTAGARTILETAAKANPTDPRLFVTLGRLREEANDLERAAVEYQIARKLTPHDRDVLERLVKIYSSLKNSDRLTEVLTELAAHVPDDLPMRMKLATLHRDAGRHADAAKYTREALFVDVNSTDAKALLLESLKALGQDAVIIKIEARYK